MANFLSTFFHRLGDACECDNEITAEELQLLIEQDEISDLRSDVKTMKEVVGFLGARLKCLEDQQRCKAKIVKLKDKDHEI